MKTSQALIADQLERQGIAIIDNFLPEQVLQRLLTETKQLLGAGEFHPALIGRGITEKRISEIRGDKIKWLEQEHLTASQADYFQLLEAMRLDFSNYFRIALPWFECHLATYPPGSFYAKHLDQFRETNNRIFSVILYLNEDWKPADGGQLRIHRGNEYEDIQPLFGRFVCFRSDLIEHEVLLTHKTRFSITGWMRRDVPTPVFL